jgi:hypothetical protein
MENPFEAPLYKQNFSEYLRQELQYLAVGEVKYVDVHGKSRPAISGTIQFLFKDRKFRTKADLDKSNKNLWIKRTQ